MVAAVVAVALGAIVVLVVWAATSFAVRQRLTTPATADQWVAMTTWIVAVAAGGVAVRFGVVSLDPEVSPLRLWGAVAIGIGVGLLLNGSPAWSAACAGVGWGIGAGRSYAAAASAAAVGVLVALVGLSADPSGIAGATALGIASVAVVGALLALLAGGVRLIGR